MPRTPAVLPRHLAPLDSPLGAKILNGEVSVAICTDVGDDADDTAMLIAAARMIPKLAVFTSEENCGQLAQAVQEILDRVGRTNVPLYRGRELSAQRFILDTPELRAPIPEPVDLVDATRGLCEASTEQVLWIGCGPATNLAHILTRAPELTEQLTVTWMGGWLDPTRYRSPGRASHNFRADTRAAGTVLRMCHAHPAGPQRAHRCPGNPDHRRLRAREVPGLRVAGARRTAASAIQAGDVAAAWTRIAPRIRRAPHVELPTSRPPATAPPDRLRTHRPGNPRQSRSPTLPSARPGTCCTAADIESGSKARSRWRH
ncbi:nucleoside hydrolase [Nocardia sp. alder85J]|uniref:nucleoside hydrolase n=1 Tax=Nocardia sp. alder85J TaxID=2862949 RepID=UPI001CD1D1F2|nr:nucleoside hydrolase [Nocardia sp. alder85J]MCX4094571.1 nucleoside hydrolase [Nocardia sp. alder85J]